MVLLFRSAREGDRHASCLRTRRGWVLALVLALSIGSVRAERHIIPAAPPEFVETGAPSFVVLGPASIGLSAPPTDLQLLPDGRILLVAQRQIAFGDGTRWETFQAAEGQEPIFSKVAVDPEGRIYYGIEGGIGRIELGNDARWRTERACSLPTDSGIEHSVMLSVASTPSSWYWHGGSGAILAWRPSETPRLAANVSSIEQIFPVGPDIFISDRASGGLYRIASPAGDVERVASSDHLASETVTCAVPFAPGVALVGTIFNGLKLFDGTTLRPFGEPGSWSRPHRFNDLCAAGEGLFAAAIDTVGIVFFDRNGKIVQVLERALDHRLGRVQQLRYARNGVLWALLNEGIAQVQFPSPISHFEPLVPSGLGYARPLRHQGRLWLLADGRAFRGVYSDAGRLERFEEDAPAGRYVFNLDVIGDQLFATNDAGIFQRGSEGWILIAAGVVNGRLGLGPATVDRIVYVARDELGILEPTTSGYAVRRTFVPKLGDVYNSVKEDSGFVWLELGSSRVARLDPRPTEPTIEIFDTRDGLVDGWVEAYDFDGVVRFHLQNQVLRFDEASRRFVPDKDLLARFPHLRVGGRPAIDREGRMWFTSDGSAHVMPVNATGARQPAHRIPVGFAPSEYTVEENSVVWMFLNRRLARVDLRVQPPPSVPLRAIVTAVEFSGANQHQFAPKAVLDPVAYADNSLAFRFAAPVNPFAGALTFEVLLEGAGSQWASTGVVGSASFHRLKEGNYAFRVRPVLGGTERGTEARIAFRVLPPWYRSTLAWIGYSVSAVGVFGFAVWFPAFLHRRENDRLEQLVTQRTEELHATNQQLERQITETTEKSSALAASEERYRALNAELEERVDERTAELSLSNDELQHRESLFRLIFEHAPVGISWKRTDLGDTHHFNDAFRRILRLPVNAPGDHRFVTALIHPEDAPRLARMDRLIATGAADSYTLEQRFVLPDSTVVWTSVSVAVVRDRKGSIVQDIGILEDITGRKQAENELATTYRNLMEASRMAGMAEVATGVLHNVGNVLTSLNVSANLIANGIRQSKADSLSRLSALLHEHTDDLPLFLSTDPKGKRVPEMVAGLATHAVAERDWLAREVASMQRNIDHIKEIVAMQQSYATVLGVVETLQASSLFEDALRMNSGALARHDVTVVREFLPVPLVRVEKGKVLQILINLIRNAKYACDDANLPEGAQKMMTVRVEPGEGGMVRMIVRDNGVGIAPENLTRIFAHGFTTRSYGHGFGLHSSALAAKDMKGSLTAASEGPGKGATFVLEIPGVQASASPEAAPTSVPLPEARTAASRPPFRSGTAGEDT